MLKNEYLNCNKKSQMKKGTNIALKFVLFIAILSLSTITNGCVLVEDNPESYTITFKANYPDGNDKTVNILSTQKINEYVPSLNREGYDFKGWFTNKIGDGVAININQTIDSDLTLYAIWEPKAYSLSVVTNIPGDEKLFLSLQYDAFIADYLPLIHRYGYEFDGWYSDRALTKQVDPATTKNVSISLFARWSDVKTDYYVATNGSDDGDGSPTKPFQTFEKAISMMAPGDAMIVFGGTYNQQLFITNSGTENAWLTFKAYENEKVILDGTGIVTSPDNGLWYGMVRITDVSYIIIDGFEVINATSSAIFAADSHHINIINNHTINSQNPGIFAWYTDDLLINGNEVESACMHPDSGLEDISLRFNKRVIVSNNHVHHSDNIAIDAAGGVEDALIYDNLVEYTGLGLYVDSWDGDLSNVQIYNNISRYNNIGVCVNTENGGTVTNVNVYNNLVYGNTDDGMVIGWGGVEGQSLTITNVHYHSNKIYNNLGDGVVIYGQSNSTLDQIFIYNNFIYDNLGCGIVVSGITAYLPYSLNDIWLINNTILNNGSAEVWSSGGISINNHENAIGTMDNIYIQNNMMVDNFTFSISLWPWGKQPNTITISHNLISGYRNAGGFGETKGIDFVEADPGFSDSGNRDLHLSSSSKAIDAGISLSIVIDDFDFELRNDGQHDIGADEYHK